MGVKAETFSLTLPEPWAGWVKGLAALFGSESAVLQMCVIFTRGTMPRDIGQLQALVAQIRQGAQEEGIEIRPAAQPATAGRRDVVWADPSAPRAPKPALRSPRGGLHRTALAAEAVVSVPWRTSFLTRRPAWSW